MICGRCGRNLTKANWSKTQWTQHKVVVVGADMWQRNCCKDCSDFEDWYFTWDIHIDTPFTGLTSTNSTRGAIMNTRPKPGRLLHPTGQPVCAPAARSSNVFPSPAPPPPLPLPYTLNELDILKSEAILRLGRLVDSQCWVKVWDICELANGQTCSKLETLNEGDGLTPGVSLKKRVSYDGGIKVFAPWLDEMLPNSYIAHTDRDGTTYVGPTNLVYKKVFEAAWPGAAAKLGIPKKETTGD